ncbi:unnamed protein product [Paramecium pentaurelia]|uniref:Transmembrane protein n=1 Tax=Paramecium pentaurelia TaxID=43138 RepID=A0A8S1VS88_9CILI|nr:unnamed protein product [Paramecium pentaurelia]
MIQIFYLLCLALSQEDENQRRYLQLGESVQGFVSPRTQNHHVYLFIVPEIPNQTDLVVQLKTLNPNSDPNLYISKSVQEPLTVQDADVQVCEAQGMEICVINNEKIKENDILYISVVSRFPSRYILRIEQDQEQTLMIESFLTFKLTRDKQSQIIDFTIPKLVEQQTEIEINVQVVNQEFLEEPFQVFMNKYENGPPDNNKYDYKATDTWDNQKVIEFTQTKPFEQYRILIQGEQGAVFRVMASRRQKLKMLNFYETITQVVEKGDFDFYQVNNYFSSFNCDIAIRLTPFKGYAKLFVHYNNQPPLLESYEWQEENKEGEIIYITQQELINKNISITSFYIAVMGEELCTYELQATCQYGDYIMPGSIHQKFVQEQEIIRFDIFDYRNEGHQIQVNLHTLQGIINFIITNCNDQQLCSYQELFKNQEKYEQMTTYTMIYLNKKQEAQYILNCESFCSYYILAMLDNNSKQTGKFTIQYKVIEKTMNLISNTPHKSQVEKASYQNYKFFVSEEDQIRRLQFLVTPIQGDLTMYLSTVYQQPNEQNYEYKSQNNSINFGGRFANQPHSGTYYLSIYGESFSKYIITVWVIKNFQDYQQLGKFPWHYIQLYQGDQHEHYLVNEEFVLYKIDLKGYGQKQQDSLNVILQKEYGQFQIFGFDHPETDESKAIWQSGQIISILNNDIKYPEILYLKIRLEQIQDSFGSFRIAYYSYNYIIDLFLDEPFFNFLSSNNLQNFRYEYGKKEVFVISKRSFEFDQSSLLIDFQPQFGLDIRYYQNNSTIVVQQNEENYCLNQQNMCSEYFQFYITSKFDTFYSILISKIDKSEIQLKEDQPITKVLPIGEDYFYLYCQGQEVNILAFSYYGELTIFAKIVTTLNSTQPNPNEYDKVSKNRKVSSQASIYFSQDELKNFNCIDKCIIKITVVVLRNQMVDINSNFYDYTIQYNSKLIMLRESEIQEGLLIQNGYKFYKIHVNNNDTNLMIMLKPDVNCDADLIVSKSKFPNHNYFDWGSFDLYSDVLIIEPGNNIDPNLPGDYYVGVHGYQECQFAIQYHLKNVEAYDIFQNQPYKFFVGSNYTVFLKLQSYQQTTPFMIFVQSHSETAYFYVDETDQISAKFNSYSQDITTFKYNNFGRGYQKYFTTESLKQDNVLIIALKTYTSEIVTVQVNNNEEEIFLESQTLFQYSLENNKTVIFTLNPNSEQTILQINLFSGSLICTYSFESLYQQNNFSTLILLNIRPDNYNNTFNITNQKESYLKINFEAIYSSYFSIQYFTEIDQMDYIYSIYPVFFTLKAQSEKEMYYLNQEISPLNNTSKTFIISIQVQQNYNDILTNQKNRALPLIKVYQNTTQLQLLPIKQTVLSNLIQNEYIDIDTTYKIILQNQAQFEQYYQIQIGTSDLRPLIPKIKQLGTNQLYQSSYWALQQNFGYLFYEMQFCNGIFSVYAGKDLGMLSLGQYDNKIDIRQNKQVFGFFDKIENTDFIFLKFDLIKSLNSKIQNALYTIRVYYVDEQDEIPYDQFFPGLQGYLTPNITDNHDDTLTLFIEFAPLQFIKKNQTEIFEMKQIEYFVILQEKNEDDDLLLDYCSEPSNQISVIKNYTDNETSLQIQVPLSNLKWKQQRNFVFTILATVDVLLYKDEQKIQLDYYYEINQIKWNQQQIMIQESSISFNYQWIGICIVMIILIIALILFVKMRRNIIISKYENNEISNQQTEGIEMHYRGLNE